MVYAAARTNSAFVSDNLISASSEGEKRVVNQGLRQFTWCFGWICFVSLLGCPSSKLPITKVSSQQFGGTELEIVAPKSLGLPGIWDVVAQEWTSESGATVQFTEYDAGQAVPKSEDRHGQFLIFPLNQLCEIDSRLVPLPTKNDDFESRDMFKGLRERVISRDLRMVANPVSVPVLVCYIRRDLLSAAGKKLPETWDEYHELVQSLEIWAPGLIAVEPLSPEFRSTTFFARSLAYCKHPENYSVWFDIDSAKPTLTSPGFVKALETAQKTWSLLPKDVIGYSPADCRRLILTGKAAIALSFEPSTASLTAQTASVTPDFERAAGIELAICRLPGSKTVFNRNSQKWDMIPVGTQHAPALCGFAGLATGVLRNSKSDDPAAATNLLVSLSSSSVFDHAFAALPKGPCREGQAGQAVSWFVPELSSDEASQYCDATAQSLRDMQLTYELPVNGADDFRQATSKALEPLLRGDASVEQTLTAMQQAYEAIVASRGAETVRDSHRRGLGMAPVLRR